MFSGGGCFLFVCLRIFCFVFVWVCLFVVVVDFCLLFLFCLQGIESP